MVKWTRRRTVIGGDVLVDDWMVSRDGRSVGRVHLEKTHHDGDLWMWSTYTYPSAGGRANTLEEGLELIRSNATARWSYPPYE